MSSSDEKIIQSVDAIISAVGQLVDDIKAANDLDQHKKEIALEKVSSVAQQMDEINHAIFVDTAGIDEVPLSENSPVETSLDEESVVSPRVVPLPLPVIGGSEQNDDDLQDERDEFVVTDEARDTPWSDGDEVAEDLVSDNDFADTIVVEVEMADEELADDENVDEAAAIELIHDEDEPLEEAQIVEPVKQPRLVLTPVAEPDEDLESDTRAAAEIDEDDLDVGGDENNLQLIKGIDEDVAALLNRNGISSFKDVAAFKEADIIWISEALGEPGRVARGNWIEQAALLAADTPTRFSLEQANIEFFDRLALVEAYSQHHADLSEEFSSDQVPELNQDVLNALASDYLDTVGEPPAFLKQDDTVEDGRTDAGFEASENARYSDNEDSEFVDDNEFVEDYASMNDADTGGPTSIGFVPNLIKKLVSEGGTEESRTAEIEAAGGADARDAQEAQEAQVTDLESPVFEQNSLSDESEDADSAFISQTLLDKKRELEAELAALTAQMQHQTEQQDEPYSGTEEDHQADWSDDGFASRTETPPVVEILDHQEGEGALTVPLSGDDRVDDGLPADTGAIWHEEVSTAAGYVPPIVSDEDVYSASESEHASSFETGAFGSEPFEDGSFNRDAQNESFQDAQLNDEEAEVRSDRAVGQDQDEVFESSDIALPIGQKAGVNALDQFAETEFSEADLTSLDAGEEEDYWSAVAGADHQHDDRSAYESELDAADEIDDRMTDPEIEVPVQRGFLAVPPEQPDLSGSMIADRHEMTNDQDARYEDGRDEEVRDVTSNSQPLGMYLARKIPANNSPDEQDETEADTGYPDMDNSQDIFANVRDTDSEQPEQPVRPPELPGAGAPFSSGPPDLPPVPLRNAADLPPGGKHGGMPPVQPPVHHQPPVQPALGRIDRDGRHDAVSHRLPGEGRDGPMRPPSGRDGMMPPTPGGRPPAGHPRGVAGGPPLPPMAPSGHLAGPPSGPPSVPPSGPPVVRQRPQETHQGAAGHNGTIRNGALRDEGRVNGMRPPPNREMGRNGFPQRNPQRYPLQDGQPPMGHDQARAEGLNNGNGEIPAWSEFSEDAQDRSPQKGKGVSEGFRERAKKFAENLQKSLVEKE